MEQIIAYNTTDTICALSTPAGRGGIAVVRVSGPDAIDITNSIWKGKTLLQAKSHTTHLGTVLDTELRPLDQALATIFRTPNSFTGENVVEISVHGSIYIQQQLLASLIKAGARMAEPGEFTRRAYLNSRLDLAEAEAVADIIASSSRAAHALAMSQLQGRFSSNINVLRDKLVNIASLLELELDFSEEDVTFADRSQLRILAVEIKSTVDSLAATFDSGQAIVNGIPVAIVGRPNVGKSRLLNTLLQTDRAIVSDIPGTTRDTVEDTMDIHGTTFRFIDTAGIRHTDDPIEKLGIDRAKDKISKAKIIIWLISPDELTDQAALEEFHTQIRTDISADSTLIMAINKIDTINQADIQATSTLARQILSADDICNISALKNTGIDNLKNKILELATTNLPDDESMIVTNARHHAALQQASQALATLLEGLPESTPTPQPTGVLGNTPACALPLTPDLLAYHLREAKDNLATITGTITSQEILNTIFSRFCVGK
ncbi:MAG: tRNA uridine-5-carboxymethylaminomethyl(34) synthesis GTPase MnmE [Muribaculaceae bacterium]